MSSNILKVNRHTINSIYIWNLVRFARAISRCEGSRCWFSNNSLNAFRIRIHILRRSPHAMPIEVKLSQNYVHIRPPNSPLKTQDPRPETRDERFSSCPKWFIGDALRNQRSNRSAVTSTSSRFSNSSQGPATSSSNGQLYIYLHIYVRILLLDFWLNINSIKIICDRINVKVIRALRGLCGSVSKCWKTKSLLKLAIAVEKALQLSIYNIYIHTIHSGTRLERNLSL